MKTMAIMVRIEDKEKDEKDNDGSEEKSLELLKVRAIFNLACSPVSRCFVKFLAQSVHFQYLFFQISNKRQLTD